VSEQPPWNPYDQQDPNQWRGQPLHQGQPPYPPQQPYGQQPYPGQPPYQEMPYGQPYRQPRPFGQQQWPPSPGHGRPRRKSWPRRHKVLTALGGVAGLIVISSIASQASSGGHQTSAAATAPAPPSSASAAPSSSASTQPAPAASAKAIANAEDACGKRPASSGDIYVRMIQPGQAPVAQELGGEWVWNASLNRCLTSVQMIIAAAPRTPLNNA
jgi:hypothetical protein